MKTKYPAVAFDLDGTLYPNHSFYIQIIPFLLKESKYMNAFRRTREFLHGEYKEKPGLPETTKSDQTEINNSSNSFYKKQAQYMAKFLGQDPLMLEEKTEKMIYRGWEPLFKKVKLFSHVKETIKALRDGGAKLAVLSDFPPHKKLENLGLSGLWDVILCSEEIGMLKPAKQVFQELIRVMNVPADEILYVGNSFKYDIQGAAGAGMKTAWIRPKRSYLFPDYRKERKADFVFFGYRQLKNFVLI